MKLTFLGHACFLAETEDAAIVFDPFAPGKVPGVALPHLSADMVISSHEHPDHCYPQAVKLLKRRVDLKTERIETFHDDARGSKRGLNTVTAVELDGLRIVHMGDIGHPLSEEQLAAIGRPDVLMIPVGGYYTIDAAQARVMADALGAHVTIPMHYRGEGFGYDVISNVDEFAALSKDVVFWDSNVIEINRDTKPATVVLKCPVK